MGLIKGDARSLDYSSQNVHPVPTLGSGGVSAVAAVIWPSPRLSRLKSNTGVYTY